MFSWLCMKSVHLVIFFIVNKIYLSRVSVIITWLYIVINCMLAQNWMDLNRHNTAITDHSKEWMGKKSSAGTLPSSSDMKNCHQNDWNSIASIFDRMKSSLELLCCVLVSVTTPPISEKFSSVGDLMICLLMGFYCFIWHRNTRLYRYLCLWVKVSGEWWPTTL